MVTLTTNLRERPLSGHLSSCPNVLILWEQSFIRTPLHMQSVAYDQRARAICRVTVKVLFCKSFNPKVVRVLVRE